MSGRVQVAVAGAARVGEGPVWDPDRSALHWVDILAGEVMCSDLSTGVTTTVTTPTLIGAAVLRRDRGGYVVATAEGFGEIDPDGNFTAHPRLLPDGQRMNDAKCDPFGRLWSGSTDMEFRAGAGALHVLGTDFHSRVLLSGMALPNGMGWSPDGRSYYLADTVAGEICSYHCDLESTSLTDRRLLRSYATDGTGPDGMCVDSDGTLWVAVWGRSRVEQLAPDGELLTVLDMPVAQPSSCAFGGAGLDRLFVTSAREDLELADDALDGSVFVVDGLGVTGLEVSAFAG